MSKRKKPNFATIHALLSALLVVMPVSGSAGAGQFEDAVGAYDRGDYFTALRLLRPLAVQGQASAQYNFGIMYARGQGVQQDYAEALKWYRRAADQGLAVAENNIGQAYYLGQGVPPDEVEAAAWYRKAAEKGNPRSQLNLGVMYDLGKGVPRNLVEAHKWLSLAISRLSPTDTDGRASALQGLDQVSAQMTPTQIADAQKLAREWKPK